MSPFVTERGVQNGKARSVYDPLEPVRPSWLGEMRVSGRTTLTLERGGSMPDVLFATVRRPHVTPGSWSVPVGEL